MPDRVGTELCRPMDALLTWAEARVTLLKNNESELGGVTVDLRPRFRESRRAARVPRSP